MSVNVSIVRPRSASVCHQEASFSTRQLAETVTLDDLGPDLTGVGHLLLERRRRVMEWDWLDAKRVGQPRPQPAPPEDVPVDDVERRVRGGRRRRRPDEMLGK